MERVLGRFGRPLTWAGSAGLHVAAGALLLVAMPDRPAGTIPVTVVELALPEPVPEQAAAEPTPAAEPEAAPMPEPPMAVAEAAPEMPPVPEPAEAEPAPEQPPPPVVAETPPPPEPPEPEPATETADNLPMPPPPPPRPAPVQPRRPAAPAHVQPVAATPTSAPAVAPTPAPAAAPTPAAAPPANYVAQLFAALERHKSYPYDARQRRAQGVAMLRFRMRRDGTVVGYRLERSTGDGTLDEAVLTMIQRASPLPAPPAALTGDPIELTVPVRFALR